jgi:hypothetical protein
MRRTIWTVLVGVYLCMAGAQAAIPRVRPLSDRGQRLLAVGRDLSPTIRAMLDRVEQSDIIMQLDLRLNLDVPNAVTQLVTATPDFRYVRVSINPRSSPARRLELLGHELQHVLEIASDVSVRTQDAMRDLFTRIGRRERSTGAFETEAALNVESVIRQEVGKSGSQKLKPLDQSPSLL